MNTWLRQPVRWPVGTCAQTGHATRQRLRRDGFAAVSDDWGAAIRGLLRQRDRERCITGRQTGEMITSRDTMNLTHGVVPTLLFYLRIHC
jgi:hypothetical protein